MTSATPSGDILAVLRSRRQALHIEDLANLLSLSTKTLYKHAACGLLPAYRLGGAIRFSGSEIADWIERQSITR